MKRKNIIIPLLICLLASLSSNAFAQVTIGSGITSNSGALLDLKEEQTAGTANSKKGLALPRVVLTSIQPKIGELAQSIGNTGTWDESAHTGLVVYNVKNTLDACVGGANAGVYTWDGKKWNDLYTKLVEPPTTEITTDVYGGANSYILPTGGTVEIPVERAYRIWTDYAVKAPALPDPTTGKVLNLAYVNGLVGDVVPDVVWQEKPNVLATTNPITVSGSGKNAKLIVKSGTATGNALISVRLSNGILWQWHIWVTDDAPKASYMYNTGKRTYWFMDRSMGAAGTSGTAAYGLYYQWGRHVPIQKEDAASILITPATASEGDNLTIAIQSKAFITYANTTAHDWYSPTAKQWDGRWGDMSTDETVKKSPFDPCPYGWRVASAVEGTSPWHCLDKSTGTGSGDWSFEELGRQIGFYATSGYRSNGTGSLGDKGIAGYVWTASPAGSLAGFLYYNKDNIKPYFKYNRGNGMNVRCMKEVK